MEALWRRAGAGRGVRRAQAAACAGGIAALFTALVSPVDSAAESLFAVHMAQHLLLMAVAAPLLVLAAPQAALAWGMPRRLDAVWRRLGWLRRGIGGLARPAPALALHSLALWTWHVPAAYDAAVRSGALHALEHASFLGTALLFWWAVLQPGRTERRAHGPAALLLFVMAMQGGLLGALLAFSGSPWYASHLGTTAAWGATPVDDQQLAGLVMWIPGGASYLLALAWLLVDGLRAADLRVRAADARRLETFAAD